MGALNRREISLAITFYALTSISTLVWWACLIWLPESRAYFLGREFGEKWLWILIGPDTAAALVMSTLMVWALTKKSPLAVMLAWTHFGAQGYAWAISVGLAVMDPQAYWGVVAMTFSVGVALAFAIRIHGVNVLWGAFRFQFAKPATVKGNWLRSLVQTTAMWGVFLAMIPSGIALLECSVHWNGSWFQTPWLRPAAAALFICAASLGLWSTRSMTRSGEGTPLPSACTRKLVTDGPYRFIRNPMAVCGVLQGVSVGLAFGSSLIVVYALIGGIWWEILVRHLEEDHLTGLFGDEYLAFAAKVPCWRFRFPRG